MKAILSILGALAASVLGAVSVVSSPSEHGVVTDVPEGYEGEIGLALSASEGGAQAIVDALLPTIIDSLIGLQVADVSGKQDSIEYSFTNIVVASASVSGASVTFQDAARISIQGLDLKVTLNWSYREHIWPHLPNGKGTADATAKGAKADVGIYLIAVNGKPQIVVDTDAVDLGHFDITIHGSIFSWLYDILIDLFKGPIKKSLQKSVEGAISKELDETLNEMLASFKTVVPVSDDIQLDYSLPVDPQIAGGSVTLFSVGEFQLIADPTAQSPAPHHALPEEPSGKMVDIALDEYVLNSGAWAVYKAGLLEFFITDDMIPDSVPVSLNTSFFKTFIPKLYQQYPDEIMTMNVSVSAPPDFSFSEVQQSLNATAALKFNLPELPLVFVLDAVLFTSVEIGIKDQSITLHIDDLTTKLTLESSQIGEFSPLALTTSIQLILNTIVKPLINTLGRQGIPLPSIDGFELVNTEITPKEGYFHIATDIDLAQLSKTYQSLQ